MHSNDFILKSWVHFPILVSQIWFERGHLWLVSSLFSCCSPKNLPLNIDCYSNMTYSICRFVGQEKVSLLRNTLILELLDFNHQFGWWVILWANFKLSASAMTVHQT